MILLRLCSRALLGTAIAPLLILATACSGEPAMRFAGEVMGTRWNVTIAEHARGLDAEELRGEILAELERVDRLMSTWRPDSEISRFNAQEPGDWFPVSDATARVVEEALHVGRLTGGAFDITVAPLVELWGFGPGEDIDRAPAAQRIAETLASTGAEALQARGDMPALRKSAPRRLDLSAIAKGFAVDQVAELLQHHGIGNYLVEVGGEVRTAGRNPRGEIWRIGVESPQPGDGVPLLAIRVSGLAVATSGDYRNFRVLDGQTWSHTIDPRTGYPVREPLASVTVVASTTMYADALATALGVLGVEAALALAEREGLAVYLVEHGTGGLRAHRSSAFRAFVEESE